jgi:HrpA-like helicases
VNPAEFSWQVPGLRTELVTEMIRSLPKALRRDLVPAPDVAREVVARLGEPSGDLRDAVGRELRALRGVSVPRDAWDLSKLPRHLRITVRVTDSGRVLAEGKDVAELQRELKPRLRAVLSEAAAAITRTGLTSWTVGELPRVFRDGSVVAYPALADAGPRSTSGCSRRRTRPMRRCGPAPGGSSCWARRRRSSRSRAACPPGPSWRSATTRTAGSRPCSRTASTAPRTT